MAKPENEPMVDKTPKKAATAFKASTWCPMCVYLNPLAWLLIFIDFFLWLLSTFVGGGIVKLCRVMTSPEWTVVDGEGGIKRISSAAVALHATPYEGCSTGFDCAMKAMNEYADQEAFGTRKFLGWYKQDGVKYPKKKFGATSWQTYAEVKERALAFGAGLLDLGLVPLPPEEGQPGGINFEETTDPHTLLIYEETCADWMTALLGAHSQSLAVATSYATLGVASVADAAQECNVKAIVCNMKDVAKILENSTAMPRLTHIVYTTNYVTEEDARNPPSGEGSITVVSMDQVIAVGRAKPVDAHAPGPDNMAVIMYTSGSTGKPKGVMIRQRNLCASVAALVNFVGNGILEPGGETYLAYLPAAHILELCAEFCMICFGARIGFADPKTISSNGAVRERPDGTLQTTPVFSYDANTTPPGAIQEFRPTFMAAVPKIWDIMKKGIENGLSSQPGIIKGLFNMAFSYKNWALNHGMETPLFNKILFHKKFKQLVGGRAKLFVTGGGPIAAEVQTFIRVAVGVPLIQGYALTETCCAGTVQYPTDPRNGVVGPPVSSIEMKLRDCVEAATDVEGAPNGTQPSVLDRDDRPYLSTDTRHYGEPVAGRGEVLIRGLSVSSGYLKQPEKTAEEFDSEGFFHTGDIAVFTPDGCLKIVDRLKNLIKLKGGEYIAIESMEKEYSKCIYVNAVDGGICCYGDGDMDRPVALMIANLPEIRNWAAKNGIEDASADALCSNPDVLAEVLSDLRKEGKAGGLGVNELLAAVHLITGEGSPDVAEVNSPWTPENQMLTASNKLNRKPLQKVLASVLEPLKQKGIR